MLRVLSADLPATATTLSVPAPFVQPRTEYKAEVLAIEAAGKSGAHRVDLPHPLTSTMGDSQPGADIVSTRLRGWLEPEPGSG